MVVDRVLEWDGHHDRIVRARHGAVQGSTLRSDRAHCARLERVTFVCKAFGCRSARDLDGAAPERRDLGNYVMAGRLGASAASRGGDAQPSSTSNESAYSMCTTLRG